MNYLEELNKIRERIWIKTITIFLILIILCFFPMLFLKVEEQSDYIEYILIRIFVLALIGYWISKSLCESDIGKYKKIYAKNLTLKVLENIFENVIYKPNINLPPENFAIVIEDSKIPTVNRHSYDDYFSATYKNIKIEYCDVVLSYTPRNNDDNNHESFKGKWIVLNFNENFKSNIQIGPRIFNGKKNGQMLEGDKYKKINMKDNEFNKKFIIYADNENEVFNVLVPDKIKKLKSLYKSTRGKIFMFFLENKIHIGIGDKKNFFEPSIYKKINLEEEKQKVIKQTKIITEYIDIFNLDKDLI